jgi:hypothetical protein
LTKKVLKDCPSCKSISTVDYGPVSGYHFCIKCSRTWDSESSYDISCMLLGMPDGKTERDEDEVYIEDGGLRNDLNDLVRQSQVHVIGLIRSQLPILDWDKDGVIDVTSLDLYLQRMQEDIKDRNL